MREITVMYRKFEDILFAFVRSKVYLLTICYVGALVSVICCNLRNDGDFCGFVVCTPFVRASMWGARRSGEAKANLKKSIADVNNIIRGLING